MLLRTLGLAAALFLAPIRAAIAQDADPAVAQARLAADEAHEQLVDRYRAIWVRLSPSQKSEFSARERAWLNGGRAEQERRCVASLSAASGALALQTCRLAVTEHRIAMLSASAGTSTVARTH
jgi:uncharacterized protein YecT (DUF1311 family)